jgi:hypothetical protein
MKKKSMTLQRVLFALVLGVIVLPGAGHAGQDILQISKAAPNRIVTPYKDPQFITNVPHEAWTSGNVLYLLPTEQEQLIGGFIQDKTGEFAVSVLFEPVRIPPQTIELTDPNYEPTASGGPSKTKSTKHTDQVVETLVSAWRDGEVPGFRQMAVEEQLIYVGPIRMELVARQRRGQVIVEQHRITNDGGEPRQVSEASFPAPNRMGVMVFPPMTEIDPGVEASVYIMRRSDQ